MNIALSKTIKSPNTDIVIRDGENIFILDTDDGVVKEVPFRYKKLDTVLKRIYTDLDGLKHRKDSKLCYRGYRITDALDGNFHIDPYKHILELFDYAKLEVELKGTELSVKDGDNVIISADFQNRQNPDIKGFSCAWLEKIGDWYRAAIEIRLSVATSYVPRIVLFLLFDREGYSIEDMYIIDSSTKPVTLKILNYMVARYSIYGEVRSMAARLSYAKPIWKEFSFGYTASSVFDS